MQLRHDLTIAEDVDRFGEPILVVCDPVVRRLFSLPAEAEPVLDRLRQPAELADLVAELGELFSEAALATLVRGLAANHLLDEGLDAAALRSRLRAAHREEQWSAMQRTLQRARTQVPVYRELFASAAPGPEIAAHADLVRLPYLTKAEIRAHYPDGFIPVGADLDGWLARKEVRLSTSSGTSAGERLQMIFTSEARGLQMAAGTAINDRLSRLARAPQAVLTSMHCADPDVCVRYSPEMSGRIRDGNRLLLMPPEDPGAPTLDEVNRMLDELRAFGVRWLDCNPRYLVNYTFAALDAGLELPRIDAITCGFEFLSAAHRAALREAWGCEVYNRYTASELGNFQIIECHHGTLHVNDRYFYPEVVRAGRHVRPGEVGRLVQTTLREQIPLVRYDTGDLVVAGGERECACGGVGVVVDAIAGRAADLLAATDGSPRTTLDVDRALSEVEGLRTYQIEQTTASAYHLKVIVAPGAEAPGVRARAAEALRSVVGSGADVRVAGARFIYPESSGKFRLTRSGLPQLDRWIPLT